MRGELVRSDRRGKVTGVLTSNGEVKRARRGKGNLPRIDVLQVWRTRALHGGPSRLVAEHDTLMWLIDGTATVTIDGTELPLAPFLVLAYPKGTRGVVCSQSATTWLGLVEVSGTGFPEQWMAREFGYEDIVGPLLKHLLWLGEIRPDDWRQSQAVVAGYLLSMVGTGAAATRGHVKLPEPVKRAFEFVVAEWPELPLRKLTLDEIATAASVTPGHLSRLFVKEFGMGPMSLLRLLRLQSAADLLIQMESPIRVIATEFGFPSEYHFSSAFKKAAGVAPREYRRTGRFVSFLPPHIHRLSSYVA